MGDWWIYPMVGVGIAFVAWIFGAGQEEGIERAREALASHEPAMLPVSAGPTVSMPDDALAVVIRRGHADAS